MQTEKVIDELLVLQCQHGDEKAFQLLVNRWHQRILAFATRLTGNHEASKDIAQESWQVVFRKIGTLKDPRVFKTWIFRIVNNKCVDWIRKNQKERIMEAELSYEFKSPEDENEDLDNKLVLVEKAIDQIPKSHQMVLRLFYLEQLSLKEISTILDISTGTVKSRLFHAREHLKKIIKP